MAYSCNDGTGKYVSTNIRPDTAVHTYIFDVKNLKYIIDNGDFMNIDMGIYPTHKSKHTLALLSTHDDSGYSSVTKAKFYEC